MRDCSGSFRNMAWIPRETIRSFIPADAPDRALICKSDCEQRAIDPLLRPLCVSDARIPPRLLKAAVCRPQICVLGTNCTIDGPFSLAPGADYLNIYSTVWVTYSASCSSTTQPFKNPSFIGMGIEIVLWLPISRHCLHRYKLPTGPF